jgi:hypothetical protein
MARFLAWYTSGALALACLFLSAATVLPGHESGWWTFLLVIGAAAATFAVIGIVLCWLPKEHWCNRSRTVRVVLSVAAVLATLLMVG